MEDHIPKDQLRDRESEVLQPLDTCCKENYERFQPSVLLCYNVCVIEAYEVYFSYKNTYNYCEKCFNGIIEDSVTFEFDFVSPVHAVKKSQFKKLLNDKRIPEPLVECLDCGKVHHTICVLHLENISPEGFTCDNCLKLKSMERARNLYTSQKLNKTNLSSHIEARVDRLLQLKEATSCIVNVRVVSSVDKIVSIPKQVKERFAEIGHSLVNLPYRSKVIVAFQLIDGVDVCFFAMTVQQYDSECPAPNTRKVYISYVDSVNFFKPKEIRTELYHEIILGYLDYIKKLGYTSAHVWSAAPRINQNFIFNYRPREQKLPNYKQLKIWYEKMINKGIKEGIVVNYVQNHLKANKESLIAFPYFQWHFWPSIIEKTINDMEIEEIKASKVAVGSVGITVPLQTFSDRLIRSVVDKKNCYIYFTIHLNSYQSVLDIGPIIDPDHLDVRYIVEDHFSFWVSASQRHMEFNSMRKAKYSTKLMIYNILQQRKGRFVSHCIICRRLIDKGYKCEECCYYNLCRHCIKQNSPPHEMVRTEFTPNKHELWAPNKYNINLFPLNHDWIMLHLKMIYHSEACEERDCKFTWCAKARSVFKCACQNKLLDGCSICRPLMDISRYHAQECTILFCELPYCRELQLSIRITRDNLLLDKYNQLMKKYQQQSILN